MIKLPKLDNRTYSEIREEAIRNIIKHCPEWTNHNSSDPGITLIELFSAMTEMLSYQLNRVPKKNYLAFLDMLGIEGRMAQASKALVKFSLSSKMKNNDKKLVEYLKKGTQVATGDIDNSEPIIFETIHDLGLVDMNIIAIYSEFKEKEKSIKANHFQSYKNNIPFIPFSSKNIPIYYPTIYLSSNEFKFFKEKNIVTIAFLFATKVQDCEDEGIADFFKNSIVWEYYNGESWKPLSLNKNISYKEDELAEKIGKDIYNILSISFYGNVVDIEKYSNFDIDEEYTIKATFKSIPKWINCIKLYNVAVFNHTSVGVKPDSCFLDDSTKIVNFDKSFYPFGKVPKEGSHFYIENNLCLSSRGKTFDMELIIDSSVNIKPNEVDIRWEYWNGEIWKKLELKDVYNDNLNPKNYSFTKDLTIQITTPNDIEKKEIYGEEKYVIKVTINKGNYGEEIDWNKKQYELAKAIKLKKEEDYDIYPEEICPPLIKDIVFHYTSEKSLLNEIIVNNGDFNRKLILKKDENEVENIHFLFKEENKLKDSLYIMFDGFISDERLDVFFEIDEENEIAYNSKRNLNENEVLYTWEIYNNDEWQELENIDETENLTQSGRIMFFPKKLIKSINKTIFNEKLTGMLIRAKLEFNILNRVPAIKSIYLNSVMVEQKISLTQHLGVSNGLGKQEFSFTKERLCSIPLVKVGTEEYKHVNRFIEYSRNDAIYRFDYLNNIIQFGDNRYGKIPDAEKNITISYEVTKGSKGNISKGEIQTLKQGNPIIDSVTNVTNATGGSDEDSLDDLIRYAPNTLLSRDRAVTLDDYKALTINFSSSIITAKVFNDENNNIVVLVITKDILEKEGFINRKLLEDLELSLKEKSLVTVFPIVKEPIRVYFDVELEIKSTLYNSFTTQREKDVQSKEISIKLKEESEKYFDLKTGGFDKRGFPIDREVSLVDFNYILNQVNDTYYIVNIKFRVNNRELDGNVLVDSNEILLFNDINVEIVE